MNLSTRLRQRFPLAEMPLFAQVLVLAARGFFLDNGGSWAAAIAYYSLLSLFPLLLAAGSIAAWFVDPAWAVHKATGYLGDLLPGGPESVERIVTHSIHRGRESGLLFALPLLWTATLVFNAVAKALNVAFETAERLTFWKRTLLRMLMLLTLGGMFLLALASSSALRILHAKAGAVPGGREFAFPLLSAVLPVFFMMLAFFLSYRFVPRRRPHWRAAARGAGVAALLFAAAKPLFLGYVQKMARYNVIYGSLTGIIIMILWIWVVAMIGLFGGQVAAHTQAILIEKRAARDVARRHLHRSRLK